MLDFDLDESLDVLIVRDSAVEVYGRGPQGDWQELASADVPAGTRGAIAADLDRDFQEAPTKMLNAQNPGDDAEDAEGMCLATDPDLCVFGEAGLFILKNQLDPITGQRTLEAVPQSDDFQKQTGIRAATFADLDQDGDLDLVGRRFFGNFAVGESRQ